MVRRVPLKGMDLLGQCALRAGGKRGKHFFIEVDSSLDRAQAWAILLHEWAHALNWTEGEPDHSAQWGKTLAELWREHVSDSDYEAELWALSPQPASWPSRRKHSHGG